MQQNNSLFDLDEIVWARVVGYPHWPAKVSCVYEKTYSDGQRYFEYVVNFYKDISHAVLKEKALLKYADNYDACSKVKYRGLNLAVQMADSELRNQSRKKIIMKVTPVEELDLQIILNCLTFDPSNIIYLWTKLNDIVSQVEIHGMSAVKSEKIFKCVLKILKQKEQLLSQECPKLDVTAMVARANKILNPLKNLDVLFSQDTLSEEQVIRQTHSEETEEEPRKFFSAFAPVKQLDIGRLDALKHPKSFQEQKPIILSLKQFQPIILQ